jgi:hypothetical protein
MYESDYGTEHVALTSPLDDDPEIFHTRECHSVFRADELYAVDRGDVGELRQCQHCQKRDKSPFGKPPLKDGHVWVTGVQSDCYHSTNCNVVQTSDDPKQVPKQTRPNRRECKFCTGETDTENEGKYAERTSEALAEMNAAEVFGDGG